MEIIQLGRKIMDDNNNIDWLYKNKQQTRVLDKKILGYQIIVIKKSIKYIDIQRFILKFRKNIKILKIRSKQTGFLIGRYINQINRNIKTGCFCINMRTYELQFIFSGINLQQKQQQIIEYIKQNQPYLRKIIKFNTTNSLITNQIAQQNIQHKMQLIKKQFIQLSQILYQYQHQFKNKTIPQFINSFDINKNHNTQNITNNYHSFLSHMRYIQSIFTPYSSVEQIHQVRQTLSQTKLSNNHQYIHSKFNIFLNTLLKNQQHRSNYYNIKKIKIFKIKKIQSAQIGKGGFGSVQRFQIQFQFQTQPNKIYKKQVAVKRPHSQCQQRINHQKQILKFLQGQYCINIASYYISNQPQYKNYIFLDIQYMALGKMQNISLLNKINLLMQIIKGLIFLKNNHISHLDLKPANILISKNHTIKLIDFGQSYHPSLNKKKEFKPAFTMYFVPPQRFSRKRETRMQQFYNQKYDAYSLGVLIHVFLFDKFHNEKRQCTQRDRYLKMRDIIPQNFKLCPQKYNSYGQSTFINQLVRLNQKCVNTQASKRPGLDWILINLTLIKEYLYKYYSE